MADHPEFGKDEPGGLYEEGHYDGAKCERDRIVEWIRDVLMKNREAQLLADGIEAGTHWK